MLSSSIDQLWSSRITKLLMEAASTAEASYWSDLDRSAWLIDPGWLIVSPISSINQLNQSAQSISLIDQVDWSNQKDRWARSISLIDLNWSAWSISLIKQLDQSARSISLIDQLDRSAQSISLIDQLNRSARSISSINQLNRSVWSISLIDRIRTIDQLDWSAWLISINQPDWSKLPPQLFRKSDTAADAVLALLLRFLVWWRHRATTNAVVAILGATTQINKQEILLWWIVDFAKQQMTTIKCSSSTCWICWFQHYLLISTFSDMQKPASANIFWIYLAKTLFWLAKIILMAK